MEAQVKKIDFTDQNIYVGFDAHLKSWKVTIMADDIVYKTFTQPPRPDILYKYLIEHFLGGTYHTAYEAGYCGYWIHNKLVSFGIKSMVVNPADIPTTDKERVQKEDKRDNRKIARSLSNDNLTPIYIPSIKTHGINIDDSFKNPQSHWSIRFMSWLESIDIGRRKWKRSNTCVNLRM